MDNIEKFQEIRTIKNEVKEAALQAMAKLKKYYSYTDALPYTVATSMLLFCLYWFYFLYFTNFFLVLDSRLKLQYYKDHQWENEFIDIALEDIGSLYKSNYAPVESVQDSVEDSNDDFLNHIYKWWRLNDNELDQYLEISAISKETDLLQ